LRVFSSDRGRGPRLWPLLALLLLAVAAPTACLAWFMVCAIDNERLAAEKTREDAYRRELRCAVSQFERQWVERLDALQASIAGQPPRAAFAQVVRSFGVDGMILYDRRGAAAYPAVAAVPEAAGAMSQSGRDALPGATGAERYDAACRLEQDGDPRAAAEAFAAVARQTDDAALGARAMQGQVRCLTRSGNPTAAVAVILKHSDEEKYRLAVDAEGRRIMPNAELLGLTLLADPTRLEWQMLAARLQRRLEDYDDPMPSPQRCFLMHELERLAPGRPFLPLVEAEELAAGVLETRFAPRKQSAIQATPRPDAFAFVLGDRRAAVLVRLETLRRQFGEQVEKSPLLRGGGAALCPPQMAPAGEDALAALALGGRFSGWQCAVDRKSISVGDDAARRRIAMYLWVGALAVAVICGAAVSTAAILRRQVRLARLKNDLVATVSHEMKTPLTSMRVLVETLLDADVPEPTKTRDYLQLIAKENLRLSGLIDNFLAFSRMERNRQVFQMGQVEPAAVVRQAVEAVRERLDRPGCRLDVDIAPQLPTVVADADALTTVLVNLLDNAIKYTGEDKDVRVRTYQEGGAVCFAVADNGIGVPRWALKKIFARFYQVDRRLSRSSGGCGLGLSIVECIVTAHGGTVEVESRPAQGSTFTVRIPAAG
jgi:signal transduction histidine kinase